MEKNLQLTSFLIAAGLGILIIGAGGCADAGHREAAVPMKAGALQKELLIHDPRIGIVTDITRSGSDPANGAEAEIGVVGSSGVLFLDEAGKASGFARLAKKQYPTHDFKFIDGGGSVRILRWGSWLIEPALFNINGKMLWQYDPWNGEVGVNGTSAGDTDGDGSVEIAVAYNGPPGGMHLLDENGNKKWAALGGEPVGDIAIVEARENGALAVLASSRGELVGLDRNGKTLFRATPVSSGYFSDFSVVAFPTANDPPHLLISREEQFVVLTIDGSEKVAELKGPFLSDVVGLPVKLSADQPPYFAVLGLQKDQGHMIVGYESIHACLYVYDAQQALIYREVFANETDGFPGHALLVVPSRDDPDREVLLVGNNSSVWRYSKEAEKMGSTP